MSIIVFVGGMSYISVTVIQYSIVLFDVRPLSDTSSFCEWHSPGPDTCCQDPAKPKKTCTDL